MSDHDRSFADLLLAVADDKLILGHRNADWTGLGPILEEDIAFSSIAQDEIAHASAIYELLAPRLGTSADDLAYGRDLAEYRCAAIVELPDDFDWATAIVRQLVRDHFDVLRLERLGRSSDDEVAALARRLRAEEQVHVDHADEWIGRLGRGSDDSRRRIQAALAKLAAPATTLLESVEGEDGLESSGRYPPLESGATMCDAWRDALREVTSAAGLGLDLPALDPAAQGGRRGRHTEHLAALLDEMTEVYRTEPGAAW